MRCKWCDAALEPNQYRWDANAKEFFELGRHSHGYCVGTSDTLQDFDHSCYWPDEEEPEVVAKTLKRSGTLRSTVLEGLADVKLEGSAP